MWVLVFLSMQDNKTRLTEAAVLQIYMDVHRRFVQSDEGFAVLLKRWKRGDFGSCSCWRCSGTHFLPVGLDTIPGVSSVKLFCPCCKEIYNPPAPYNGACLVRLSRLALDGAFFGREIPSRFLSGYSDLVEEPKPAYRRAIFGFIIHPSRSLPPPPVMCSPYYQNATRKGAK